VAMKVEQFADPEEGILFDPEDVAFREADTRVYLAGLAESYVRNHRDEYEWN